MAFTDEDLEIIFDRSSGHCHLCHKKLCFSNYGLFGQRGNWSVDHSKAQARGGTHHGNNLWPACISCNSSKGRRSSRSVRAARGLTRPPLSKKQIEQKRRENIRDGLIAGGASGFAVGAPIGGPIGGAVGTALGVVVGVVRGYKKKVSPKETPKRKR